jgi:membrane-associated phospholipid phosphatase
MILLVAAWLWVRRRFEEFRYYAFLLALGFLVSYVGYFLVPVRGPWLLLDPQQGAPLSGLWSFQFFRDLLSRLEAAHYDCFPSGHTEMIILAWWSSRRISANLFGIFSVYMVCMVFSTVYLRYHYTVDIFAGAVLALALLGVAPYLHGAGKRP